MDEADELQPNEEDEDEDSDCSWLGRYEWVCETEEGEESFEGCYFMCDGGHLRWQGGCLQLLVS